MDIVDKLFSIGSDHGGWGLAAAFAIVIWRMGVYIRDQHRDRIKEQVDSIKLLEGVKNSISGNEKALDRFTEKLDRVELELAKAIAERRV